MTPIDWINKIGALSQGIEDKRVLFLASTGTMVEVAERVFERGQLTNGAPIAYDQDYQVYAYTPPFPRKGSGRGKPYAQWTDQNRAAATQARKGGSAQKIKGGYYDTYLDAKGAMGRRETPFELTGQYRKSYFGGATPTPKEVNALEVVIDLDGQAAKKWDGLTNEKGDHLKLSEQERRNHIERIADIYRTEVLNA